MLLRRPYKFLTGDEAVLGRGSADAWCRMPDPLLIVSDVPDTERIDSSNAQVTFFSSHVSTQDVTWHLPMEAAGSIGDTKFFNRVRYNKALGAVALQGNRARRSTNHFSLMAIPTRQLVEQDPSYSPLIAPGNSLLLYDTATKSPVATDAQIVGLVGNGPQL